MKLSCHTFLGILSALAIAAMLPSCKPDDDGKGKGKSDNQDYLAFIKQGTLVRTSTADPCLLYENGMFFLTMTGTSNIALICDSSLGGLTTDLHSNASSLVYKSANDPNVARLFGSGAVLSGTWSPEIHYFSEEEFPGYGGWYMYLALRLKGDDSSVARPVVLKSLTNTPAGPYGSPITKTKDESQTMLYANGSPVDKWEIGVSILRIPSGQYKGTYAMWVDEVGRGQGKGKFYQRLRIGKLSSPWQLSSDAATMTQPTQDWEKKGSSSTLPEVVEGGTAIYGEHGEIFVTYCGSGYWSDYGLGQLTLKREDGEYCDPLKTSSWIKYENNPIFSSVQSTDLRGAGHATFLKDAAGNGFMCYHAYPYVNGTKSSSRNAYIEPYSIDYKKITSSSPQGVLKFGMNGNGIAAPTASYLTFYVPR